MNIAAQKLTPTVTTGPLPASRKIHVAGEQHPVSVPMREIALHPTAGEPPVVVYDASGPYTDPAHVVSICGNHDGFSRFDLAPRQCPSPNFRRIRTTYKKYVLVPITIAIAAEVGRFRMET